MIVAAGFLLAGAGSLALIARELSKAPEGYEDDHGFHTVHQDTGAEVKAKSGRSTSGDFCLQDL
jgi:hypothetical protein